MSKPSGTGDQTEMPLPAAGEDPKARELLTVDRNIAAIHRARQTADDYRRRDQIFIDHVAAFLGSTNSLYAHLLIYGLLFLVSSVQVFSVLGPYRVTVGGISLVASLEAIFLALFVLINQRRMATIERKNADLHLQMSLLAEHEVTHLARVTDLIARHLGVDTRPITHFDEVKKEVRPEEIMARIESHETQHPTDSTLADPLWKNRSSGKNTTGLD